MFNLLPPDMCQTCFHVHRHETICGERDTAPGPNGEVLELGLCFCDTNSDAEYVSHLVIQKCERTTCEQPNNHSHTEYR